MQLGTKTILFFFSLLVAACSSGGGSFFNPSDAHVERMNRRSAQEREVLHKDLREKSKSGDVQAEYQLGISITQWIGTPADREVGWGHMRNAAARGHARSKVMVAKHDFQACKSEFGREYSKSCEPQFASLVVLAKTVCGLEPPRGTMNSSLAQMVTSEFYSRSETARAQMWQLASIDRCKRLDEVLPLSDLTYVPRESVEMSINRAFVHAAINSPLVGTVYPSEIVVQIARRLADLRREATAQGVAPVQDL